MGTLKIIDNSDNTTFYRLIKSNISVSDDTLYLSLYTDHETIVYEIKKDDRERDITRIEKYITEQVDAALNEQQMLCISEYLVRHYIYVGNDDARRQFTATRK